MSRTLRLAMIVAATALVSALTLSRAQTHPASDAKPQAASAPVGAAFGASEKDIEKAAAATTSPTTKAVIAPDAKDLVEKMTRAYADLKSLELTATISSDFNVDGQKSNESAEFHASFAAPNKFRHEVKDDGYVGADGEKVYAYTKEKNVYMTADASKQKVMLADLPDPVAFPLASEDLSLVLAISPDPLAELSAVYPKIDKAADVSIDGKPHPALKLTDKQNRSPLTVALDPSTYLIRRVVADVSGEVLARGAAKVDRAQ